MGLSSCFILLGCSLLYANSGTTNMDGLYIITSISDNIDSWYKPFYINFSLLIFSIGFLFKVSAAPFHFWSPERGLGKSFIVGNILPNSGNPLELLVPSYTIRGISGRTNHPCKATSQEASEKNVGNHGSKSAILSKIAVKEQRVYGSWHDGNNLSCFRYILMGFGRNYQVKIPSFQLYTRQYSTNNITRTKSTVSAVDPSIVSCKLNLINPFFITGFTDGEGSFMISVRKSPAHRQGWKVQASFVITLHKKDLELLKSIRSSLGGIGSIDPKGEDMIQLRLFSIEQITNIIIPHFDKYPLLTQKKADFELFKLAVEIMKQKGHLTPEGLQEIVNIKASMNKGLSNDLKEAFPHTEEFPRPLVEAQKIKDPNWLAGFTSV